VASGVSPEHGSETLSEIAPSAVVAVGAVASGML
jgi:hypothetical protein